MKKGFMVAAILVVVVSMFIGCVSPSGSNRGTGKSGETVGCTSESSSKDIAHDVKKILVVPEDVKKVVDAAVDLFAGEDQWVNSFEMGVRCSEESLCRFYVDFYIETTKEPADEQFRQMVRILKELGYPQEDIHLDLSDQGKRLELLFSSEETGSVKHVYVSYNQEFSGIYIKVSFDPSDGKVGLDVDKGEKYGWSCVEDVANMLGINIKNVLESVSYIASYEGEGYDYIGLSIKNFKNWESPVFNLVVEGYLDQSRIENLVDKVAMVRDTYGGDYSVADEGDGAIRVALKHARCDNNSFNVTFFLSIIDTSQ